MNIGIIAVNRSRMNNSLFRKKVFREKVDDEPKCPNCGLLLQPQWENNGFEEPDPTKWEITGYKCSNCGHKEDK